MRLPLRCNDLERRCATARGGLPVDTIDASTYQDLDIIDRSRPRKLTQSFGRELKRSVGSYLYAMSRMCNTSSREIYY